jgi:putative membrane-bound dehydrogenase-like protein
MRPRILADFTGAVATILAFLGIAGTTTAEEPLPGVERLKTSPVLQHLAPNPTTAPRTDAEQTVSRMYVPEGFKVEVIASEPDLCQPVAFAWDDRGRIWVVEAFSYPAKRPPGEGLDRVVILSDEDGDGRFETRKVFAENLNLASAIEVGHGGVWVGAAPELLFIPDRNGDDKPDGPPEVMLDGFGYQDTHETLNSFLWGPDGWLYGIQGVFNTARIGRPGVPAAERPELRAGVWRFHPVRRQFEIFAHGGSNPWGLDYDEHGQLFMTHCRSFWGRGPTTHVIQGGQFWNQVNAHYAPYIIPTPPTDFPDFRNYLLASARYDHGAGGAGVRGSDAIYGGHSHVGTMIYLGDNWPDEYRGHLFTHNLGGHQINQQINKPLGSGFDTVHAGRDMLFCTDPKYVAVDLQYGPDGAVYIIDWYDQGHCHNSNTERWDRSNGRLYRMEWQATYHPVKVNLGARSDMELAALQSHKNQWFARTARRLLQERAQTREGVSGAAKEKLLELLTAGSVTSTRLNALWALHLANGLDTGRINGLLDDRDAFVRAWTIHLSTDGERVNSQSGVKLAAMAGADPSPVVRRYLASALQRVPGEMAWPMIEALARHGEDRDDRIIPFLLWHGMATQWSRNPVPSLDRALAIAAQTSIPQVTEWVHWFAATQEGAPLNRVVGTLKGLEGEQLRRRMASLWLAMETRPNVPAPAAWKLASPGLLESTEPRVRRLAERLAASFGDTTAFPRLRETLADAKAPKDARDHALAVLSRTPDRESLPIFVKLLDDAAFRTPAITQLGRFDSAEISSALIQRFGGLNPADRSAVLNTLTSRPSYALALLDAVDSGKIARDQLTAFHATRMTGLNNAEVDKRVTASWGQVHQTPAEKQSRIAKLEKTFTEAPLWAYSAIAGKQNFQKLCMACHRLGEEGARLGPELTGAGRRGARYYIENIIEPDAVIGTDFQATTVETRGGDSITGLLAAETAGAITLRTTTGEVIVPKADIRRRAAGGKSLMPEGLLDSLNEREQIELLKFLVNN